MSHIPIAGWLSMVSFLIALSRSSRAQCHLEQQFEWLGKDVESREEGIV